MAASTRADAADAGKLVESTIGSVSTSARPKLVGQVAWTFSGNVLYAACQWAMLVALTKAVSPQMVGHFSLGLALAAPIVIFTNLQLRSIQATDLSVRFAAYDYLKFRALSSSIAFIFIVGVAVVAGYDMSTVVVIVTVGLYKSLESLSDSVYGHLQRAEQMRTVALSMILRGIIATAALVFVLEMTKHIVPAIVALGVVCVITFLCWDLPALGATLRGEKGRADVSKSSQIAVFGHIARLGIPLGATSALLVLATNAPRYFLEQARGAEALGYFAAIAYPMVAFTVIAGAVGQAASPRLSYLFAVNRPAFWRLLGSLAAIQVVSAIAALALGTAFGKPLLAFLYRDDYATYHQTFLILIVASGVWAVASILGYAATASGQRDAQAALSAVVCSIAIAAGALLVPRWGLDGAAIAFGVTGLASLILYASLVIKVKA